MPKGAYGKAARIYGKNATCLNVWFFVKKQDNGCWLWTGRHDKYGYGWMRRPWRRAHRFFWWLANKQEIPLGLGVLHRCDTPSCVNPDHLFLGTQRDNMLDAFAKGRLFIPDTSLAHVVRDKKGRFVTVSFGGQGDPPPWPHRLIEVPVE